MNADQQVAGVSKAMQVITETPVYDTWRESTTLAFLMESLEKLRQDILDEAFASPRTHDEEEAEIQRFWDDHPELIEADKVPPDGFELHRQIKKLKKRIRKLENRKKNK